MVGSRNGSATDAECKASSLHDGYDLLTSVLSSTATASSYEVRMFRVSIGCILPATTHWLPSNDSRLWLQRCLYEIASRC
jgi:hypothetical protein